MPLTLFKMEPAYFGIRHNKIEEIGKSRNFSNRSWKIIINPGIQFGKKLL
jgi:hypothetical protein